MIVDYMNSVPSAVKSIKPDTGYENRLDLLGDTLAEKWGIFESVAREFKYDLLEPMIRGGSERECAEVIRRHVLVLLPLLYAMPGASGHEDIRVIREKDLHYGGSWCKRGGTTAFHMLVRKWDRIAVSLENHGNLSTAISVDVREEGLIDDVNDLRRYLILVLAWHLEVYR